MSFNDQDVIQKLGVLRDKFGRLQFNKLDINEITQYVLIRELLKTHDGDAGSKNNL